MEIYTGRYQVLESGIVVGIPGERISFVLNKSSQFIIHIEFNEDHYTSLKNPQIQATHIEKNTLLISLRNFSKASGHGNVEPLEVGVYGSKKLYLNYRVFSSFEDYSNNFKKGGVTFVYTWLVG